jgi:hypothetical protein
MSLRKSHIGRVLQIALARPATIDNAGFGALTWHTIDNWETLPQFGLSHNDIEVPNGSTGFTQSLKGAQTGVATTFAWTVGTGAAGTGQTNAITAALAAGAASIVSLRIVDTPVPNATPVATNPMEAATGYLGSLAPNQGTNASYEGFSVTFRQDAPTVIGTVV